MSATRELAFDQMLPATPGRVFAALTEGRHLERWFCDACESEPEEDGRLTMRWHRMDSSPWPYEATWVVFEPPLRCACHGGHQGYPNRDVGLMEFTLAPCEGGTRVSVRHAMPATPEYEGFAANYQEAWPRALARLARYLTPSARTET